MNVRYAILDAVNEGLYKTDSTFSKLALISRSTSVLQIFLTQRCNINTTEEQ